jgi:hypothetical protein
LILLERKSPEPDFKRNMSNKLQLLKEKHELEEHQVQVDDARTKRLKRAYMFLGGIHTVQKMANSLKAQELRAIEAIETEKLYSDMGFETFNDFLKSEESPISKSSYYEKIKLLNNENEQVFDLLNEIGVAQSVRKLLGSGDYDAITIEGDKVRIGENEADLSNFKVIKDLIESYADDCKRLNTKLQKGEDDNKRRKDQIRDLEEKLNSNSFSTSQTALEKSNSIALGGLAALAAELENATIIDCNIFAENSLKLLATQYSRVNEILCRKLSVTVDELNLGDDADRIAALLED